MNSVRLNNLSLKYQMVTHQVMNIWVLENQSLWQEFSSLACCWISTLQEVNSRKKRTQDDAYH